MILKSSDFQSNIALTIQNYVAELYKERRSLRNSPIFDSNPTILSDGESVIGRNRYKAISNLIINHITEGTQVAAVSGVETKSSNFVKLYQSVSLSQYNLIEELYKTGISQEIAELFLDGMEETAYLIMTRALKGFAVAESLVGATEVSGSAQGGLDRINADLTTLTRKGAYVDFSATAFTTASGVANNGLVNAGATKREDVFKKMILAMDYLYGFGARGDSPTYLIVSKEEYSKMKSIDVFDETTASGFGQKLSMIGQNINVIQADVSLDLSASAGITAASKKMAVVCKAGSLLFRNYNLGGSTFGTYENATQSSGGGNSQIVGRIRSGVGGYSYDWKGNSTEYAKTTVENQDTALHRSATATNWQVTGTTSSSSAKAVPDSKRAIGFFFYE